MQKAAKDVVTIKILDIGTARALQRKIDNSSTKHDIETSCMMMPASIVCVPGLVSPGGSLPPALDANPPPTACMMIESTSKPMKTKRYVVGPMKL